MNTHELQAYLSQQFQGEESFLETIVYPIFGEENFESAWDLSLLESDEDLLGMAQRTGIKDIIKYGTISSGHTLIDVFEVTVNDYVLMQRNRVGIQQLVRRVMSTYTSAFIIFHYEGNWQLDWRFSFCQKDDKEVTEAKRYTFLLGPGQSCKTAAINFEKLFQKAGQIQRKDIIDAFSVEVLSEEFFDKYKEHYVKFVKYITGKIFKKSGGAWKEAKEGKPNEPMYAGFRYDDKRVRDYVKKLLGRIVFLHFLQKKGWLGVEPDKEWGSGDRNFMWNLFTQSTKVQKDNFLDEVLEPLFNGGFDTNRTREHDLFNTNVVGLPNKGVLRFPYLNGGLFSRDEDDEVPTRFPQEYFHDLLDFFNQYNFTIDENDPGDAEVGIDPEMLGEIFENLLEDNKDKGAYYTPKEIVRYMCRESLILYLQNGHKEYKEQIRHFVLTYETSHLPDNIVEDIDRRLKSVKVCDPAIGSGAFPMGLLRELFFCRAAIENFTDPVDIKRHIIQENIYGVDLEKGAVDIARLRFWLTLVVDEASPEVLPNLDYKIMQGNSMFTTFNGQYLNISSNQRHTNIQKINEKKGRLYQLQNAYFGQVGKEKMETSIQIKNLCLDIISLQLGHELSSWAQEQYETGNLPGFECNQEKRISMREIKKNVGEEKRKIIQLGEDLRQYINDTSIPLEERSKVDLHFFDWRIMYSDVFAQGGFDIVIGNPPYGAKLSSADTAVVKGIYGTTQTVSGIQKGSTDSYTIFIELAYMLMKNNGFMAYIVPISLTSSDSLTGVHRLLLQNCVGIRISSYAVRPKPVFKNAVVNTSILMFQKTKGVPCKQLLSTKMYRRGEKFNLQQLVDNLQFVDVKDDLLYGRIPKIGTVMEKEILNKLRQYDSLSNFTDEEGAPIYYRTSGGRYFKVVTNYSTGSSKESFILFKEQFANAIGCVLSSNLSFWYYQIISNNLDWKSNELLSFTMPLLSQDDIKVLESIYNEYLADIEKKANVREASGNSRYKVAQFREYKIVKSKTIIDRIDDYIGPLYGLTAKEVDFIKNYELEFRMAGDD
jgi:type I restriction-modification system DNA methylase subunit